MKIFTTKDEKAYFNTLNEARQWAREQRESGYILKPTITVLTVPVDAQLAAHVDYPTATKQMYKVTVIGKEPCWVED